MLIHLCQLIQEFLNSQLHTFEIIHIKETCTVYVLMNKKVKKGKHTLQLLIELEKLQYTYMYISLLCLDCNSILKHINPNVRLIIYYSTNLYNKNATLLSVYANTVRVSLMQHIIGTMMINKTQSSEEIH